jgi:diacylglycerol kinase family enzyme
MIEPSQQTFARAPYAPRPHLRRIGAVVNPLARGVGADAVEALARAVAAFGTPLHLVAPPPEELERAIRGLLDSDLDLIVVLAGDGTARAAARFCGPDGPALALLPGGTMNVLPNALNGAGAWPEILQRILEEGVERVISGGKVGGRPFYTAAVLGSPALFAPVREALRRLDVSTAWKCGRSAVSRAFAGRLRFESNAQPRCRTTGLGLICPHVSRVMNDRARALEAALLDQRRVTEVLRLGLYHLRGDWRADPAVATTACRRGRAWAQRPIPAILDGESFRLERSVDIAFVPRAFRALVPPPADE